MKCVLNVRGMRFALLLCPLCLAGGARGQPVPDPRGEPVPEVLTPPKLIEEVPPEYPAGASGSARVVLQLDVDERGAPGNLLVLSGPQPGFDESALAAARKLRFDPARRGGQPIAVRIQYAFNFAPPAAAQPPRPEELPVNLAGRIRERGTRRKLSGIEISAAGRSASTDREGRFELRRALQHVQSGPARGDRLRPGELQLALRRSDGRAGRGAHAQAPGGAARVRQPEPARGERAHRGRDP